MTRRAIIPEDLRGYYTDWRMSPGHQSGDHIFMTGFTGVNPDGTLPPAPEDQIRNAFRTVGKVLEEAGLDFSDLVEMTSYHVGLKDHLDLFKFIRNDYVCEPYPAWTAIEVAGFVRDGAIVEIRAIARTRSAKSTA